MILSREDSAPLAYIAGSLGTLIGADLTNLDKVRGLGAPIASIGGAGTFDGIFLTGILAVLLAGLYARPRAAPARELREAPSRVLPPALLHWLIVLAGPRTRIGRLGVPIALEKEAEAIVAPVVAARNGNIDRRPAHHEAALGLVSRNGDIDRRPAHQEAAQGLVVEHRNELGAIVGLAARRLVRDDDRGSRQCRRRDAIEHILRDGDAVERVLGVVPVVDRHRGPA